MKAEIKKLGRYEIIEELGRGGMGIVLKGKDPQIDRLVALKIVKLEEADSMGAKELIERFYIEAKAAGKLNHPNIVTIYDVGEEEGKKFIAMEYIEGHDLAKLISEGPLPLPRAAKIVAQIADGLAYANQRGIVHRDIKPGNILLSGQDMVKITDFGLARLATAGSVTQTGHAVGSPSYMSPEQVQGLPVDGRSDMFSLGVVLYESLTGKRPFEGESLTTVIFKIIKDKPLPPSALNKALPPTVDMIVEKMMAKDPANRYKSCAEVARDLMQYVNQASFHLTSSDTVQTIDFKKGDMTLKFDSKSSATAPLESGGKFPVKAVALFGVVAALIGGAVFFSSVKEGEKIETKKETAATSTEEKKAAPAVPAPLPAEEKKEIAAGSLKIATNPAGASVKIDGKERGKSPLVLSDVEPGDRQVEISLKGYEDSKQTVNISKEKPTIMEVKLSGRMGTIKVDAPKGTTVFLDGSPIGQAPLSKEVVEGEHKLKVEGGGLTPFSQTINVKFKETAAITAKMAQIGYGSLNVTAVPWATIYVNGKEAGTTPKQIKNVAEGKTDVRLVNPGYRPYSGTVTVKKNEQAEFTHTFTDAEEVANGGQNAKESAEEAGAGTIKVTSTPSGRVFLDGKAYGDTPVTIQDIPAGAHNMVLKRPGMQDYKRKINVTQGITTNIAVE